MQKRSLHCLVTGGLGGIGGAIVTRLRERGDRVTVFDCIPSSDGRVRALEAQGATYLFVDLASVASIKEGFAKIDSGLDVLVNNAGITKDGLAIRMNEQDWDAVLDVNLKGSFFCAQQALLRMMKQPHIDSAGHARGYIITMSSVVGKTGNPGQVNYAASKAGLIALTKTLAQEYASRQILVNAIAPGFIQTAMTDKVPENIKQYALERIALKRFGEVHDIADLVLFLSSGSADYITGQVIEVTGGMF